ncbi:MAG: hypothetical protein HGA22_02400 [Clostridiales bacterium]|nr:hypothetical protein [Clostridiales bacterium]
MFCLAAVSLILAIIGFAGGGAELVIYGIMNNPGHTIIMFAGAGVFAVSLLTGIGFKALCKDISEELKYIDTKNQK